MRRYSETVKLVVCFSCRWNEQSSMTSMIASLFCHDMITYIGTNRGDGYQLDVPHLDFLPCKCT